VWSPGFEGGRCVPIAFEKNTDGSTKRMFVQIFRGAWIPPWWICATRKELNEHRTSGWWPAVGEEY